VAARKAALEQQIVGDQELLKKQAAEEAAKQQAEFDEKQKQIAKAKRNQLLINLGVVGVGGAIIYFVMRD